VTTEEHLRRKVQEIKENLRHGILDCADNATPPYDDQGNLTEEGAARLGLPWPEGHLVGVPERSA
jgi:hypothetical protein